MWHIYLFLHLFLEVIVQLRHLRHFVVVQVIDVGEGTFMIRGLGIVEIAVVWKMIMRRKMLLAIELRSLERLVALKIVVIMVVRVLSLVMALTGGRIKLLSLVMPTIPKHHSAPIHTIFLIK